MKMVKINQLIKQTRENWGENPDNLAIEVWLAECVGKDKTYLFINGEIEVDGEVEQRYWQGVNRLMAGEPLAQLIGYKEFYGIKFQVNADVLIPRPESELLVDLSRKFIQENCQNLAEIRVIDVGTGSGCILLSLAVVENQVKGLGLEISEEALKVARTNLEFLKIEERVNLKKSDLLQEAADFPADIILANLPYIGTEKFNFVANDVEKYEPAVALFGGSDGLDLYRKMFDQLQKFPWKPRLMIGEFGFGQAEIMETVLKEKFPEAIAMEIINDLAGIPRVFVLKW
ncbi:peptide chain release factor N(5)-glutamine methyltransferase [Candidatus Peregrinibacteria bacterium]|nr:peptide chain release factor N(5)-glutamine methyltransferase [Candidatus Peregrinibacteria bacterium]